MKQLLKIIFVFICSMSCSLAHATENFTWGSNGKLLGATGIQVGTSFYDMTFIDGTCAEIFSGCDELSDFSFRTESDALRARDALQKILVDGPNGLFSSKPDLVSGCNNSDICAFYIPFAIPSRRNLATEVKFVNEGSNSKYGDHTVIADFDIDSTTKGNTASTYIVWTPSEIRQSSAIPEPSTTSLLMCSLLALFARIKRQTATHRHSSLKP